MISKMKVAFGKVNNKFILDACCGGRMFWENKKHPNAIFQDIRKDVLPLKKQYGINFTVEPDVIGDFRKMDFPDKSFKLIIWDPPHIIQRPSVKCRMTQTYGCLNPETWQSDLKLGFKECWRVLEDYGVLIFKWSDCNKFGNNSRNAKLKTILSFFPIEPLIAQKVKETKDNQYATFWCCFMKIPQTAKSISGSGGGK